MEIGIGLSARDVNTLLLIINKENLFMTTRIMDGTDKFFNMMTALAYDEGKREGEMILRGFYTYEYLKKDMIKNRGKIALVNENNELIHTYVMPWEEEGK